jgi:hypothetical protein
MSVSSLHFEPAVRFEQDDIVRMGRALDELMAGSTARWQPAQTELVSEARSWLSEAVGPATRSPEQCQGALDRFKPADRYADEGSPDVIDIAGHRVLDILARLLDASELLQRQGRLVEAFALEGIQGRLLEAAVGAGRIEPG